MRKALFSIVALSVVVTLALGGAAFADKKPEHMHGTWKIDVEKMVADFKGSDMYKEMPPEAQAAVEKGFRDEFSKMELVFEADKFTVQGSDEKTVVNWKVLSQAGDKWEIETKEGDKPAETFTVAWIDDDHVTMTKKEESKEQLHLIRKKG